MLRIMDVSLSSWFLWKGGKSPLSELLLAWAQVCHECLTLGCEARPRKEIHFRALFGFRNWFDIWRKCFCEMLIPCGQRQMWTLHTRHVPAPGCLSLLAQPRVWEPLAPAGFAAAELGEQHPSCFDTGWWVLQGRHLFSVGPRKGCLSASSTSRSA